MDDHLEMSGACPDVGIPTDNQSRVPRPKAVSKHVSTVPRLTFTSPP